MGNTLLAKTDFILVSSVLKTNNNDDNEHKDEDEEDEMNSL